MTFNVGYGLGPIGVVNGISVDEDGDLVLYRKVCDQDREKYPDLGGVDEVWITMRLPVTD
jgi:hypothetical protein